MKRVFLILIFGLALLNGELITILDNGVERKIEAQPPEEFVAMGIDFQNSEIVVKFKDSSVDIESFINKYKLSLKNRLQIGFFIFKNSSNVNDKELIEKIVKEEREVVKTIRPNYNFGVTPR
jgi:hypothetical protein